MNKTETTIMPVYNSISLPASWLQKELCRSCYKWGVTMSSEEWSLSEKTHILLLKQTNKKIYILGLLPSASNLGKID